MTMSFSYRIVAVNGEHLERARPSIFEGRSFLANTLTNPWRLLVF
jgi:hypothetical protein